MLQRGFSSIAHALQAQKAHDNVPVKLKGWITRIQKTKNATFLQLTDGSTFSGIQVVLPTASRAKYNYSFCTIIFCIVLI